MLGKLTMTTKKLFIFSLTAAALSIVNNSAIANDIDHNFIASANIQSFCKINTQDINFGVINSPLTSQNSSSEMNVLCSNKTPYEIDLSYGGEYAEYKPSSVRINSKDYSLISIKTSEATFAENGVSMEKNSYSFRCSPTLGILFSKKYEPIFQGLGYNIVYTGNWVSDSKGICNADKISTGFLNKFSGTGYDYGVMNGSIKGDALAYRVTIPGDINKVWQKGNNSYKNIGTGENQSIYFNVSLVPDKSTSKYLAQDIYLDTVTATISY